MQRKIILGKLLNAHAIWIISDRKYMMCVETDPQ